MKRKEPPLLNACWLVIGGLAAMHAVAAMALPKESIRLKCVYEETVQGALGDKVTIPNKTAWLEIDASAGTMTVDGSVYRLTVTPEKYLGQILEREGARLNVLSHEVSRQSGAYRQLVAADKFSVDGRGTCEKAIAPPAKF